MEKNDYLHNFYKRVCGELPPLDKQKKLFLGVTTNNFIDSRHSELQATRTLKVLSSKVECITALFSFFENMSWLLSTVKQGR